MKPGSKIINICKASLLVSMASVSYMLANPPSIVVNLMAAGGPPQSSADSSSGFALGEDRRLEKMAAEGIEPSTLGL